MPATANEVYHKACSPEANDKDPASIYEEAAFFVARKARSRPTAHPLAFK